jgi:hypothetical protein
MAIVADPTPIDGNDRSPHIACEPKRDKHQKGAGMNMPSIESRSRHFEALEAFLAARIASFNANATGCFDEQAFGATQRDA